MSVLIVIPCLNEKEHIEKLVRDLVSHNEALAPHIVIADGGSKDGTVEIAKALAQEFDYVSYLHNPKRVQSSAINLAVKEFGQNKDYLIRIDAHADYPEDYCQVLLEEAKSSDASSVVVPMDTIGHKGFQEAVAAAQNSVMGNGGSAHRNSQSEGQWVDHGHHALMTIASYTSVDGYDESFSHNEDAELDKRIKDAGHTIWMTAKTSCTYYPRSTPLSLFRQYMKYGQGRVKTILKHKMKPKPRQLAPAVVFPAIVLALLSPLHIIFAIPLLSWAGLCFGYGLLLGFRDKKINVMLLSGIAAMTMHLGWSIGFWFGLLRGYKP